MKFFVPYAQDDEQALEAWQATRKFAEENFPGWVIAARYIYRLDYTHDGKRYSIRVGQPHPYGEEALVILEAANPFGQVLYLVCTPNRGVLRGEPILVGPGEVQFIELFDQ